MGRATDFHLDGVEALLDVSGHFVGKVRDRLPQSVEAGARVDRRAIGETAEKAKDRQVRGFAEEVPQGDVDRGLTGSKYHDRLRGR